MPHLLVYVFRLQPAPLLKLCLFSSTPFPISSWHFFQSPPLLKKLLKLGPDLKDQKYKSQTVTAYNLSSFVASTLMTDSPQNKIVVPHFLTFLGLFRACMLHRLPAPYLVRVYVFLLPVQHKPVFKQITAH